VLTLDCAVHVIFVLVSSAILLTRQNAVPDTAGGIEYPTTSQLREEGRTETRRPRGGSANGFADETLQDAGDAARRVRRLSSSCQCAVNENGRSGYIAAIIPVHYKRGVTTDGYSSGIQQRPLTATSPCGHEYHAMAGTMTKTPSAAHSRGEEPVRNHGGTAASVEDCLDGLAAGRGHGSSEAADSLMQSRRLYCEGRCPGPPALPQRWGSERGSSPRPGRQSRTPEPPGRQGLVSLDPSGRPLPSRRTGRSPGVPDRGDDAQMWLGPVRAEHECEHAQREDS